MEIIFQNNATSVQSYHLDGYAFFVVGLCRSDTPLFFIQICFDSLRLFVLRMDYGLWTENSRGTYNKWDGVARSTIQVLKLLFADFQVNHHSIVVCSINLL